MNSRSGVATSRVAPFALARFAPLSLIRMLWKRKLLSAFLSILILIPSIYLVRGIPNVYQAEAVVLVDSQKIPEKFVASTVQVTLQDSLTAISRQVLNTQSLLSIVDEFGLYTAERKEKTSDEIIELFRRDLLVVQDRGFAMNRPGGAFRITFTGKSPIVVAGVVNRVAELFIRENFESREERAKGTSQFIEQQLSIAKKQLDEQESSVSQFKMRYAGELPEQEAALGSTLGRLQTELAGSQDAISRAEQSRVMLESTLHFAESSLAVLVRASETTIAFPAKEVSHSAEASLDAPERRVFRSSDDIRNQLDIARRRYLDTHPEIRRLTAELREAEQAEARARAAEASAAPATGKTEAPVAPVISRGLPPELVAEANRERERIQTAKTQLQLLDRELHARTDERQRILQTLSEYQSRLERLPIREQQLAALTRDYSASKANYQSLLDKRMSAEMASAMEHSEQSERFTIADPARVPSKPVKPRRTMLYGMALVASVLLGLVGGALQEMRADVVLGEWELPGSIRIVGRVSHIKMERTRSFKGLVGTAGVVLLAIVVQAASLPFLPHMLKGGMN